MVLADADDFPLLENPNQRCECCKDSKDRWKKYFGEIIKQG